MSEQNVSPSTPMNNPANPSQGNAGNSSSPILNIPSSNPAPIFPENSGSNPNTVSTPVTKAPKPKKVDPVQQAIDSIGVGLTPLLPDPTTVISAVNAAGQGNLQPIGAIGSPIISTGVSLGGEAVATAIGDAVGGPFGGIIANIVERTGGKLVNTFALDSLVATFNKHLADIAVDMQAQGWVLGKHDLREISRDAQFRLWRKVFHFSGGGHFADLLRDSQENKVFALVEPQFSQFDVPSPSGTLNLVDLVTAVAKATIEVTF